MAGSDLFFTEALNKPIPALREGTKPTKTFEAEAKPPQSGNLLEKEITDFGAEETRRLNQNIDLTKQLGDALLKDAEGKNLLAIREKELQAKHDRERKRIRDELGEKFYNSPDMQEFKKFADESADKMVFVPSETTAPLLGIVFATIGATGMLLGGLSKGNAKSALAAMNGMAEGFAKGKEDLYKQERQTFDTNVKAMNQRMGILKAKLDVAREKMKYDAEAADLEANAAFAEAGADFLKQNKDKFGLQDTISKLETQIKQNETWAKLVATKKADAVAKLSDQKFKAYQDQLKNSEREFLQSQLLESRERQAASDRALRETISQGQIASQQQIAQQNRQLQIALEGMRGDRTAQGAFKDVRGQAQGLISNFGLPQSEVNKLGPKEISSVSANLESAFLTKDLANDIRKNPQAAGLAGKWLGTVDRYLANRYSPDSDASVALADLSSQASSAFSNSKEPPDQISAARQILKKAVDVINARSLAASGGGRVLVAELKLQKDVIGLEGMSPQTAVNVYDNLAKSDVEKIKRFGISKEEVKNIESRMGSGISEQPRPARTLSTEDKEALDWANSHPQDPRSAQIKSRLGV
jgi:hypothetical protein